MKRGGNSLLGCVLLLACSTARSEGIGAIVDLVPVAVGLQRPSAVTHAGDSSGRLFVAERDGRIRIVGVGGVLAEPFLDVGAIIDSSSIERGLLGLAFDPDYEASGAFYIAYTDLAGDSVVARYRVSDSDPDRADPDSAAAILTLAQPSPIHNVHELAFGPDGYLYVGSGDGGPGGDPEGQGQALDTLYGKLLRLDVDPAQFPTGYGIPSDNPFVGVLGVRWEIWAYGLRNPANISFDRLTGDLFIADVGQGLWEEVNSEPGDSIGGGNYGWSIMEGSHCFDPPTGCATGGLLLPVSEYPHQPKGDCAVIGGSVYRGSAHPLLEGWYLMGDFCSGTLRGLRPGCGGWWTEVLLPGTFRISALGEDEPGEIYVAAWSTDSTSVIYRVTTTPDAKIFEDDFESGTLAAWSACTG